MNQKSFVNIGKALASVALAVGIAFGGFLGLLLIAFAGFKEWFQVLYVVIVIDFLVILLILLWKSGLMRRIRFIPVIFLATCLLIGGGYLAYRAYDNSIPELNEQGVNLREYEPFKPDSRIARLSEPSTLSLSGDLPRMDCATALYPVAAAFMEATYPESAFADKGSDSEVQAEPVDIYNPYEKGSLLYQTGTAEAYQRLIDGEVDLIIVAGPSDEQLNIAKAAGVELVLTPIGREAFVFFVNANNPVDTLTVEQIQGIYSGEITNWSAVGGRNNSIRAFQRPQNSGSQTALQNLMRGKELMEPPMEDVVAGMGGIIEQTANYKNHKNAIGYSFRYFSTEMVQNNQIKLLALGGVLPTKETIRSGEYPLSSEFYAVTLRSAGNENVSRLIEWMLSPQGQYLIEETGYVAQDEIFQ